jgi:hypothetical protein
MRPLRAGLLALAVAAVSVSCVPDWATSNSSPFILEIESINSGAAVLSDVLEGTPPNTTVVNDDVNVIVNAFRKNNNPGLGTSPVEHIFLERYEVRYFRSDGRNTEGVDVPYRITGPVGSVRFHTPGPGGGGEVAGTLSITIVRHQAKLEPPLLNLRQRTGEQLPGAGVITTIAEVTIHGRTLQGDGLQAVGRVQVTFADFGG